MADAILSIQGISKSFISDVGNTKILDDVTLDVYEGESVCLLGYSGCGKTTLLRIICGFETTDEGSVILRDNVYAIPSKNIIMLFQDFNQLLPWKTVSGNIIHALLVTKTAKTKEQAQKMAYEILEEVGLTDYKKCFPSQLSGGMKQRAAFARAIVLKPQVLVMDEPFASLDYVNRRKLQSLTRDICKKHGITVLFVTHDIDEAIIMADRIVVMNANPGRINTILDNSLGMQRSKREIIALKTEIIECMEEK